MDVEVANRIQAAMSAVAIIRRFMGRPVGSYPLVLPH